MIQDCYIEEIKDIVKEKKLHMSEQELYFAEREMQKNIIEYNMKIYAAALSAIERVKMQILLLLYIGPMIRLHTEKHLLVFLKKQSKLNRAAFLIIKMHLQKLNQTLFAVGNTRIQERILIFHIRHGV